MALHIVPCSVLIRLAIVFQFGPIVYGISIWRATYGGNNLVIVSVIYIVNHVFILCDLCMDRV